MKCPDCGGNLTERLGSHPYIGEELPNVILEGVKIRTCAECRRQSVVIPKMAKLHRALAMAIAESPHKLAPGEICFLRKYLGWSGQDFAHHFGVTAETVSRWENGKKPMGATAERLLRMSTVTLDPVKGYPLPDDIGERPVNLRFKALLSGDWRIAAA